MNWCADASQTLEVATARVYNWDVTQKRKEKKEKEAGGSGDKDEEGESIPPND